MIVDKRMLTILAVLACIAGGLAGETKKADKPPAGMPDLTESSKLPARMPGTVAGRVYVDKNANGRCDSGEGVEGARVTDGVDFVKTDADGKYSITLKDDPLVPYLPSRTVSVCWPDGSWPIQKTRGGVWSWWSRLKDIKDAKAVDFPLAPRKGKLPLCVGFGTDPHDSLRREQNNIFRDEVARAGNHTLFSVMGGDLGYLGFGNADKDYADIRKYTNNFPTLMMHCIGNHDVVGAHRKWWKSPHELAGNGAFIKYLGPIRWSFDHAGVHFVGVDWMLIDANGHTQCGLADSSIDWLEKDLKSVAKGTPVYFFNHQPWSPNQRFYKVCAKYGVKLCLGGHSHRNMFLAVNGGVEYWTKMSLYTLIYIDKEGFEFVDRCIYRGGRNGWNGKWHHTRRGCALYSDEGAEKAQRGKHMLIEKVKVTSGSKSLEVPKGPTCDIYIGGKGSGNKPSKRWGLRITDSNGKTHELARIDAGNSLDLLGRKTFFSPVLLHPKAVRKSTALDPDEQKWIEMRIFIMPDRIRVIVNNRLHYQKFIKVGQPKTIEYFAEDGTAEFGRIDLWRRTWPKDAKLRATANTG